MSSRLHIRNWFQIEDRINPSPSENTHLSPHRRKPEARASKAAACKHGTVCTCANSTRLHLIHTALRVKNRLSVSCFQPPPAASGELVRSDPNPGSLFWWPWIVLRQTCQKQEWKLHCTFVCKAPMNFFYWACPLIIHSYPDTDLG